MKILILCTGNSCRSQIAHGFLQSFDKSMEVHSVGTQPAPQVNPLAVEVMKEAGIDISFHTPKNVGIYLNDAWDYVITVCGGANETCPTERALAYITKKSPADTQWCTFRSFSKSFCSKRFTEN